MSQVNNPILALIPSGYKEDKVYSVLPNDGTGDFAFIRGSKGTRVRKDGLVEEVGVGTNDIPRLDWYNDECPSLLLEPTRTNHAINNKSMDTYSAVSGSSPNPTLTADYDIAPDGTKTATRLQTTVTGSDYSLIEFPTTSTGNGTYFGSVWVKSNTGVNQDISFYGNTSSITKHTITPQWTRISVEATRGSGSNKYIYIGTWTSQHSTSADIDISVWGGQVEIDSLYASSTIITDGSATTRSLDKCTDAGDVNLFEITEGTIYLYVNNYGQPLNTYNNITLSDNSSSDYIRFEFKADTATYGAINVIVFNGSTQSEYIIENVTENQKNKIALSFKENEFKVYFNGVLKNTDTSGIVPTGLLEFNFANEDGTTRFFEGKVYDARIYDRVLTQTELQTLTTL